MDAAWDSAAAAARHVISSGPRAVVATSIPAGQNLATLLVTPEKAWQVQTSNLNLMAKGAGDVFAALYLGTLLARNVKPVDVLSAAVETTYTILQTAANDQLTELPLLSIRMPFGTHSSKYAANEI